MCHLKLSKTVSNHQINSSPFTVNSTSKTQKVSVVYKMQKIYLYQCLSAINTFFNILYSLTTNGILRHNLGRHEVSTN